MRSWSRWCSRNNIVAGLYVGIVFQPDVGFFLATGLLLVLSVSVAYLLANLGVFRSSTAASIKMSSDTSWILHFVFPLISQGSCSTPSTPRSH